MSLLDSRKFAAISAGTISATIAKFAPIGLGLWLGWPSDKVQGLVNDSANMIALIAALGGALSAVLTAAEDMARKYGVTTPPPGERGLSSEAVQPGREG